jgi:hypothetical protein
MLLRREIEIETRDKEVRLFDHRDSAVARSKVGALNAFPKSRRKWGNIFPGL